jgi:hypothetical protein
LQAPQWLKLVSRSTQVCAHSVAPSLHWQRPRRQLPIAPQELSQRPQCSASSSVLTQESPQRVTPSEQSITQAPRSHTSPAPQALPQAPQLAGSVATEAQLSPQRS